MEPLVSLTPRRSLEFNLQQILDGEKLVSVRLNVRNISKEYVAFKVKTTHLGWYYVKPNQDVLAQGESKEVLITLTDAESKRLLEAASQGVFESLDRHRFRVQTKIITAQDYDSLSAVSMQQRASQSVHIWGADSAAANPASSRADERLRVELTYPTIFQKGAAVAAALAADLSLDQSALHNHVNVTAASPISSHAAATISISTSTVNSTSTTTTTSSVAAITSSSSATTKVAPNYPGEPSPETSPEHQRERSATARLASASPTAVVPAPAATSATDDSPDSPDAQQAFPASPSSQSTTSPASPDALAAASPQRASSVTSRSPVQVQVEAPAAAAPVLHGARLNVLVCASGSVATVKVPELVVLLSRFAHVRVLLSSAAAAHFWDRAAEYNPAAWADFVSLGGHNMVIDESIEWEWERLGDVVGHIAVRKWAHLAVLAPASADILAKVSAGQADSLLLSVLRAWDFRKPCLVCPAMNTLMWDHPTTKVTLLQMRLWGWRVLEPVDKVLACNERGAGALVGLDLIVAAVREGLTAYGEGGLAEEESETLLPCLRPEYLLTNVRKAPGSAANALAQRQPVRASLTAALITAGFVLYAAVGHHGGMAAIGADVIAKAALADIWAQSQAAVGDLGKAFEASLRVGLKSIM